MTSLRTITALAALLVAGQTFACVGGQQWTKETEVYSIDVTDDTPVIEPGQAVHFDFGLFTKQLDEYGAAKPAEFTDVQVALMHDTETVMQKTIKAQANRELTGFDYTFPDLHAAYAMNVAYRRGEGELASIVIPLTVGAGEGALPRGVYGVIGLLALTVAIVGGIALARGRNLRNL